MDVPPLDLLPRRSWWSWQGRPQAPSGRDRVAAVTVALAIAGFGAVAAVRDYTGDREFERRAVTTTATVHSCVRMTRCYPDSWMTVEYHDENGNRQLADVRLDRPAEVGATVPVRYLPDPSDRRVMLAHDRPEQSRWPFAVVAVGLAAAVVAARARGTRRSVPPG